MRSRKSVSRYVAGSATEIAHVVPGVRLRDAPPLLLRTLLREQTPGQDREDVVPLDRRDDVLLPSDDLLQRLKQLFTFY